MSDASEDERQSTTANRVARVLQPPPGALESLEERRLFLLALVGAAALLLLLALPLLTGGVYADNDLLTAQMPARFFYARRLAGGDSFLWDPHIYCGYYLHGEGQAGMAHPLHWLLYKFLPMVLAWDVEFLLNYVVALAGMCFLLRRWGLPRYAAVTGGSVFAFSGFNMLHYIHINLVAVGAWMPFVLLATDCTLREERRDRAALAGALLSLLIGGQALLGHPQMFWFSLLGQSAYLLLLGRGCWKPRPLLRLGVAMTAGFLIGAVQLLPTRDVLRESSRGATDLAFRLLVSLHPWRLIEAAAPAIFERREHELVVYNGVATLVLAALLIANRRVLAQKRLTFWALGVALVAAWLALGRYGGLYRLMTLLPVIGGFRCPARYLFFAHFAGAILVALGLSELGRRETPLLRTPGTIFLPLAVALSAIALAMTPGLRGALGWPEDAAIAAPPQLQTGLLLAAAATALVFLTAKGRPAALAALVLLIPLDHGLFGLSKVWSGKRISTAAVAREERRPSGDRLPLGRTLLGIRSNEITIYGLRLADGYSGLPPPDPTAGSLAFARLAEVRWVYDGWQVPAWAQALPRDPRAEGWDVPDPMPRARMVGRAAVSDDPARDVPKTDIATTVLLSEPLELSGRPAGRADIEVDRPGLMRIAAVADGGQALVVSERYHPGWRATVDGVPSPLLPAYGIFMAVPLPDGRHTVELRFAPVSFRVGLWITCLGLALVAAQAARAWRSRHPGRR